MAPAVRAEKSRDGTCLTWRFEREASGSDRRNHWFGVPVLHLTIPMPIRAQVTWYQGSTAWNPATDPLLQQQRNVLCNIQFFKSFSLSPSDDKIYDMRNSLTRQSSSLGSGLPPPPSTSHPSSSLIPHRSSSFLIIGLLILQTYIKYTVSHYKHNKLFNNADNEHL